MRSIPSVSTLSAGIPWACAQSRIRGSTSVASSGASPGCSRSRATPAPRSPSARPRRRQRTSRTGPNRQPSNNRRSRTRTTRVGSEPSPSTAAALGCLGDRSNEQEPPHLAVGDHFDSTALPRGDHLVAGTSLDPPEPLDRHLAGIERGARLLRVLRPQHRADDLCTGHGLSPPSGPASRTGPRRGCCDASACPRSRR